MTEVILLHSPPHSQLPSSSSTNICITTSPPPTTPNIEQTRYNNSPVALYSGQIIQQRQEENEDDDDELSVLAVIVTVVRKSLVGCKGNNLVEDQMQMMEIGCPTNVRNVAHVTFDRFNGFLGLPVEFEPEVPRRPPSASTRVFGVSTESMQLSFDSRGNCVPTILLMMQRRLYSQGGLQCEGIFRINPENSQEEYVREQLNNGVIPENIDVHCLAGLIKAWFRELPQGVLDPLSSEQVMQAQSEEDCTRLLNLLPQTEAALLDWAINLMADVAYFEHANKMNARNIAMVFAPNMTQMSDPLTALMYAVQVMNFLKTLVTKTLRERADSAMESGPTMDLEPSDEDDNCELSEAVKFKASDESLSNFTVISETGRHGFLHSIEKVLREEDGKELQGGDENAQSRTRRNKTWPSSCNNTEKRKEMNIDVSCVYSKKERFEACR